LSEEKRACEEYTWHAKKDTKGAKPVLSGPVLGTPYYGDSDEPCHGSLSCRKCSALTRNLLRLKNYSLGLTPMDMPVDGFTPARRDMTQFAAMCQRVPSRRKLGGSLCHASTPCAGPGIQLATVPLTRLQWAALQQSPKLFHVLRELWQPPCRQQPHDLAEGQVLLSPLRQKTQHSQPNLWSPPVQRYIRNTRAYMYTASHAHMFSWPSEGRPTCAQELPAPS
jgi:hypothetical protein